MKLENKVAIVTGGSSGIGQAGAIALAKEGANLLITYRDNIKGAIYTKNIINNMQRKCEILKSDLSNNNDIKLIVEKTIENYSKIDILINNAGTATESHFLSEKIENFDYLLNLNVKSIFLLSQLVAKEMIKTGGGKIINITSISGISVNSPGLISYCTSKAAANMLTRAMAFELAKYNIYVNAILPGTIDTPLTWELSSKEDIEREKESTPLKKIGKPEDIAGMIVLLSSEFSDFMTGSLVIIDGGYTI